MNLDLQILPECFIDTTLAETLSFPKRGYMHLKGCNNVLLEMKKKPNNALLGIIDNDKCVPSAVISFESVKVHGQNLAIHKHYVRLPAMGTIGDKGKAVEDVILKNAEICGISMADYGLPSSLPDLIKLTKSITVKNDPSLKHLFSALKQNESSDFYKLAEWIELFKKDPYSLHQYFKPTKIE
jgi:hypothetical protein